MSGIGGGRGVPAPGPLRARPLTPRQEAFCHAFVAVPVAARAAVEAGYSRRSAKNQGWRLLARPEVQDRIRALRGEVAAVHAESRADLLAKAEAVYRQAMSDHQYQAAGRALALQARLNGLGAAEAGVPAVAVAAVGLGLAGTAAESPGRVAGAGAVSEHDDRRRPMMTDATGGSSLVDRTGVRGIKDLAVIETGNDDR